jgi:hypothetical protein
MLLFLYLFDNIFELMVFDDDGGGVVMGLIWHGNEGVELAFKTLPVTDHAGDLTVLVVLGILDAMEAVEHRTDIGYTIEMKAVTLLGGLFLRAVDVVHSHGYSYDKEEAEQAHRPAERPLAVTRCPTVCLCNALTESCLLQELVQEPGCVAGYLLVTSLFCLSESFSHFTLNIEL